MAGIYIHIPFCKQACHYCDFHFSTQLKKKDELLLAIVKEMALRKKELAGNPLDTLYFGGGTPSLLSGTEIESICKVAFDNFSFTDAPEITLEANPDDLTSQKLRELSASAVNRLSIGIQSFFDQDLQLMNRAHNASEAEQSLTLACQYFDNITVDLIYGIPGLTDERWSQNIYKALSYGIPHLSAYALTVEPNTALHSFVKHGKVPDVDEAVSEKHFQILVEIMEKEGFVHYETSNFGKEGYFSRNNTAYWQGEPYLGIGPSAHSFTGKRRAWNIRNNSKYIKAINAGELPLEWEQLKIKDRYNEYVMTGLRTIWGISTTKIHKDFGEAYKTHFNRCAGKYFNNGLLIKEGEIVRATPKGQFLIDGIAADLFMID